MKYGYKKIQETFTTLSWSNGRLSAERSITSLVNKKWKKCIYCSFFSLSGKYVLLYLQPVCSQHLRLEDYESISESWVQICTKKENCNLANYISGNVLMLHDKCVYTHTHTHMHTLTPFCSILNAWCTIYGVIYLQICHLNKNIL